MKDLYKLAIVLMVITWTCSTEDSSSDGTLIQPRGLKKRLTGAPKAVISKNLKIEDLASLISSKKTVVVLFNSQNKDHSKYGRMLTSLFKHLIKQDMAFAEIKIENEGAETLQKHRIRLLPSFYIYISGNQKHYTGELKLKNLKVWTKEVTEAKPLSCKKVGSIEQIDRHYFVYVSKKLLAKNREKLDILSKLISPLSIYSGLPQSEITKLVGTQKVLSGVWVYREYQSQVIQLDFSKSLEDLAAFISQNEFPKSMVCDKSALRFVTDFKIPILVYFGKSESDPSWDVVKEVGSEYSEYVLSILVKPKARDRCSSFLKKFLNVTETPALRILSLAGKIKRHLFLGTIDRQHVNFFLSHYVSGNLKSYALNQKLQEKGQLQGIQLANHNVFKRSMTDYNRTYLFYIFNGNVKTLKRDLRSLARLQDKLKQNRTFGVYAIDHDKNDLDGYFNGSLPLVFLVAKKGKLVHFDYKTITTKSLLTFVESQVPHLKGVKEPISSDL
jgi:hypothetical protein